MRLQIQELINLRANRYINEKRIVANYYRIRKKIAFPLPIYNYSPPKFPTHFDDKKDFQYPWAIWLMWEIEERIGSMGWAAEYYSKPTNIQKCQEEVSALCQWHHFHDLKEKPDLLTGHYARLLYRAYTEWDFIGTIVKEDIKNVSERLITDVLPLAENLMKDVENHEAILKNKNIHSLIHNIGFIGCIGMTLAMDITKHPEKDRWLHKLGELSITLYKYMDQKNYSEAAAYDGYLLDFILDIYPLLNKEHQTAIIQEPSLRKIAKQTIYLVAPGNLMNLAEIGDVEAYHMRFHLNALLKLNKHLDDPENSWFIENLDFSTLRIEALINYKDQSSFSAPERNIEQLNSTIALRTGWKRDDICVVASCSNSEADHIHLDAGTIVIGAKGHWYLSDPGYQQYMKTSERTFTKSFTAHNCPIINGVGQDKKQVILEDLSNQQNHILKSKLNLSDCYSDKFGIENISRTIYTIPKDLVFVEDHFTGINGQEIQYNWHGHSEASWWVQDGWACIYYDELSLWVSCIGQEITETMIDRQKGSRGQQTLQFNLKPKQENVQWVFLFSHNCPKGETEFLDNTLSLNGKKHILK